MILISDAISMQIRWTKAECRMTVVLIGDLAMISVYFPHTGLPVEEFVSCVNQLRLLCHEMKKMGAKHFIVGGDLNVPLPEDFENHTGLAILEAPCPSTHGERLDSLLPFMK